ncbi:MAG: putative selenate ABC transporter substrate-binding protein [Nitrosomonas sp.]|nr:putative selenate ABC transporter substrate-binding protein [Nitrosomonas sp.]
MYKIIFIFIVAVLAAAPVQAQSLVFTAIPDNDETRLIQRFSKVADYLSSKLGITVKYIPVKSYPAAVTAFRHNQVQLAWFGGLTGVQARRLTPGAIAIAQGYEDTKFKSYFIAHSSTNLTQSEHLSSKLSGKTIIFGSKSSTSGRLMPEFYIREQFKIAPDQFFSRIGFSGNHSRTIALVQSGAYQVGAVNYQVWEQELANGKIDRSKVDIIWATPEYPDYHWTVRGDLDAQWGEGFTSRLRQTILDINDAEILATFPRSSFVPANNEDYHMIETSARIIGTLD